MNVTPDAVGTHVFCFYYELSDVDWATVTEISERLKTRSSSWTRTPMEIAAKALGYSEFAPTGSGGRLL